MARGGLSGVIWGTVVAGLGAGGLSLAYPDFKPGTAPGEVAAPSSDPDVAETPPSEEASVAETETVTAPAEPETPAAAEEAPAEEVTSAEPEATEEDVASAPVAEVTTPEEAEEPAQEAASEDEVAVAEADPEPEPAPEPVEETNPEATEQSDEGGESITDEIVAALPRTDGTVGNLAENVTTGRLPSVGTDEAANEDGPSAVAPPPLERFASDAPVDDSKPLMSIVLIDDGTSGLGFEALESFPYPLTFAVDAAAPNAAELMAEYRARGLEVAALVSMPRGATASDTEVAMAGYLSAVPEAVALLEDPDASLQVDRDVSDQVIEILQASGHGIVFQSSGLNTAQKLAVREGVAAARVFRDFDGSDQNAAVIRRFLDQAAFRAGQEGGVVMLGRLRAETISALLIWGLADRASRVSLVPVSAVLQKSLGENG